MRSTRDVLALLLMAATSFGQHAAGGHPTGSVAGHPAPMRSAGTRSVPMTNRGSYRGARIVGPAVGRHGFRNDSRYGRGYGLYAPYFPISGYDFYAPYSPLYGESTGGYSEEEPPPGNVVIVQGGGGNPEPAPLPPATSAIHEYNFDKEPAGVSGARPTFTIVLKDGSMRSATASWIQAGKLHYLDSQSRQMLLSSEVIDRDATERANAEKSLRIDLPPG
jgi:hypothetical protein